MLERIFFSVMGALWAGSTTLFAVNEPERAWLFCRIVAAVVTGLVHMMGVV